MDESKKKITGTIPAPEHPAPNEWNAAGQLLAIYRQDEIMDGNGDPLYWLQEWEIPIGSWPVILSAYIWMRFPDAAE